MQQLFPDASGMAVLQPGQTEDLLPGVQRAYKTLHKHQCIGRAFRAFFPQDEEK